MRKNGALDISVELTGSGGSGDTIMAAWLGPHPHATVSLTHFADNRILVRSLAGEGAGVTLKGGGTRNLLNAFAFNGEVRVTNVDAVHHGASGQLVGGWTAAKGKADTPWRFDFNGRGDGFATGYGEFDRLLGHSPKLDGQANYMDGRWSFANLTVNGDKAFIGGAGTIDQAQNLKFTLDWSAKGPFHAGPVEIAGDVKGDGTLTGTLTVPRTDLTAQIQAIDFPQLTIQPAQLALTFIKAADGGDGTIKVTGKSAYGEAFGKADDRVHDDGLDLTGIDARAGGVTAVGSLALRGREPSRADLALTAARGALLDGGKAEAKVLIVDQGGAAQAQMRLQATDLRPKDSEILVHSLTMNASGPVSQLPYQVSADMSLPQAPVKFSGSGVASEKGEAWAINFQGTGKVARADLRTLDPADGRTSVVRRPAPPGRSVWGPGGSTSAPARPRTPWPSTRGCRPSTWPRPPRIWPGASAGPWPSAAGGGGFRGQWTPTWSTRAAATGRRNWR